MTELYIIQFLVLSLLSYPIQLSKNIRQLCLADRGCPLHLQKLGRVKNRKHTVTTEAFRKRMASRIMLKTISFPKKTVIILYVKSSCEGVGHSIKIRNVTQHIGIK